MAYVYNSILTDGDRNILIDSEKYILHSADLEYDSEEYRSIRDCVRNPVNVPLFKIVKLHNDESFSEDITPFVIENTISYSNQYGNGQRRSLSFDVINTDNRFFPSPVRKHALWNGDKFAFYMGLLIGKTVKWFPSGMYVVQSTSPSYGNETIMKVSLLDKYALLDGTVGGAAQTDLKIPSGTPIKSAIRQLLVLNGGQYITDSKPILYPQSYENAVTPYTMTASPTDHVSDLLQKLGEVISCDIYYNSAGVLTVEPYDLILNPKTKQILWRYANSQTEYWNLNFDFDYSKVVNKVTVVGSNVNGHICRATVENSNPASPTNTALMPVNFKYITEEAIHTDADAKVRAEYEIQKNSILTVNISFDSIYIPFLSDNELIECSEQQIYQGDKQVLSHTPLLLTSINVTGNGNTKIKCTNIKELPY